MDHSRNSLAGVEYGFKYGVQAFSLLLKYYGRYLLRARQSASNCFK